MNNPFSLDISPKRIYGLDIMRAMAIFFVVFTHANLILPKSWQETLSLFILDGVSLFFVLSGFLIGGILIRTLEEKGANRKVLIHFWIRRWFRTLPNYFLILFLLLGLAALVARPLEIREILSFSTFTQNLFYPHPEFFGEAWSLSIEEWFYILTPILIILGIRYASLSVPKALLLTAGVIMLASLGYRIYLFVSIGEQLHFESQVRKVLIARLDSLMFGVLGAYVVHYHPKKWRKHKKALLGIAILIFVWLKGSHYWGIYEIAPVYFYIFSLSLESIACLLLLPYLSQLTKGKGKVFALITHISLISYSMYLLNYSLILRFGFSSFIESDWLLESGIPMLTIWVYVLYWLTVIVLSTLLYTYFELPMMQVREKIGGAQLPPLKHLNNNAPE